jgi:DNA-binding response OmpR family regulator
MTTARRILIVEDDAALATVLRDNLTSCGFVVACIGDAGLAVTAAQSFAPDLVLLDVMLRGGDGFDLVTPLQREGRSPVVVMTTRGWQAGKLRDLQRQGRLDYVLKPFDLDILLGRVHELLGERATAPARSGQPGSR